MLRPGRRLLLPLVIFVGAVVGAVWGYFIQYWDEALNYPLNVGGRPLQQLAGLYVSVPSRSCVLFAVAAGFFGLLRVLPACRGSITRSSTRTEFERASQDRFVLCVEARDPRFEPQRIRADLRALRRRARRRGAA